MSGSVNSDLIVKAGRLENERLKEKRLKVYISFKL